MARSLIGRRVNMMLLYKGYTKGKYLASHMMDWEGVLICSRPEPFGARLQSPYIEAVQ